MERHQHAVVQILSHLGQVWVYASHKPELLTTSMMVFGRERPTFGDETISIASYCFKKISRVNIEQQECCVNFCEFSGFVWTFLSIKLVFQTFEVNNSNFVPFGAGSGICFSQTGASHNKHDCFRQGTSHLWGQNDIHCLLLLSIVSPVYIE